MKKFWTPTVLLVAGGLILAGCSNDEPVAPPAPTVTPTTSPSETPTESAVTATWPLTGEPVAEKYLEKKKWKKRPAVAAKIENSPAARPQAGMNQADLVYEQLIEGGETRFVVVFNSSYPDEIGPIRSVRPMDPPIVAPLNPLVVFSGGQKPFVDALRNVSQVVYDASGAPGFYRIDSRRSPHNIYGSVKTFAEQADQEYEKAPPKQFKIAEDIASSTAMTDGKPATRVRTTFSSIAHPTWQFDEASQQWHRYEDSTASLTPEGKPMSADNVVSLLVGVHNTEFHDVLGAPVPETEMVGSGDAIVVSGNQVIEGTWEKTGMHELITLKTAKGKTIKLAPGRTWVELVPRFESVEVS